MLNTERLCPGCMGDNEGEQICPICGHDAAQQNSLEKLPVRFWLADRYMVGKELSDNSEGITYIGWDNVENMAVTIREYFPHGVARRNPDKTVSMVEGKEFAFNEGLMEFLELNRKLMNIELPALVPTVAAFEENGTVYAVTQSVTGITLSAFLERNGGSLKWEQARPLFLPLIDTVKGLHEMRIIHGGISPETIIVSRDGKLRLIGLCIIGTRYAGGEFTAQVFSGYAAAEQYGIEGLSIGAHTDVYGLSATFFRTVIGLVPLTVAEERLINDSMTIPAHFADELPRQVLVALANGLQVKPLARTQTIECFKNELVYGETQENERRAAAAARKTAENTEGKKQNAAVVAKKKSAPAPKKEKSTGGASGAKYAVVSAVCTAAVFIMLALILCLTVFREQLFGEGLMNNKDNTSMPSVPSIGDVDPDADEGLTALYQVPDFRGEMYAKISEESKYERFEFIIVDKQYSDKYARGTICSQSVTEGSAVKKGTKIELTISLGPKEIKLANVTGMTPDEARLEFLKQGFIYDNIEIVEKYDSDKKPGVIIEQSPKYGTSVNTEIGIKIYVNTYEGDEEEEQN